MQTDADEDEEDEEDGGDGGVPVKKLNKLS